MKIQTGTILLNKTQRYLMPSLRAYGAEFEKRFNFLFKVAVGIGDIILIDKGVSYEQHLFVLFDTTNNSSSHPHVGQLHFQEFLSWIRQQDMFEEDYAFDCIANGKMHMVVIKLHPSCYKALQQMKQSQFSKMYTLEEINAYFKNKPDIQQILIKDHNYRIEWTKQLNALFDTEIDEVEGELDFPLRKEEETFGRE